MPFSRGTVLGMIKSVCQRVLTVVADATSMTRAFRNVSASIFFSPLLPLSPFFYPHFRNFISTLKGLKGHVSFISNEISLEKPVQNVAVNY